jgi:MFS transporter, DHA1 family, inner membrane transport protein
MSIGFGIAGFLLDLCCQRTALPLRRTRFSPIFAPLMSTKEKILLAILACVNFTHIMDFMIMMPLGPELMDLFKITPQQFGWAVSAYSITAGISGFIAAFAADRHDRKKMLLFAYIGFVAGTYACAFAPTYEWLVLARVLAGLFGGMIGAQVLSIIGDTFEYERRASAMGTVMTAFSLASVAGVPVGLWLAAQYSWHAPFIMVGTLGLITIFLIYAYVPPVTKHLESGIPPQNPLQMVLSIVKSSNQMRALALSIVLMLGHFSIIPFIAPSLVANAGFHQDQIFLIYFVGGLLTIFTSPLVGKIADQRGKYPVFLTFALLSLLPVWLITNLKATPLWGVLIVAAIFFIFVNGRMVPMQAMVSSVVPPQQRGGFMGINSSVTQLASGVAANIGGAIIYETAEGRIERFDWVGYFSIALILTSILLARRVKPV